MTASSFGSFSYFEGSDERRSHGDFLHKGSHLPRTRVLLIGLDAADWGLVSQKIACGELPNLAALAERGASGPLRSVAPYYSPAVWASIASGKCPFRHGIIGFTEPDAGGIGLRAYDRYSMRSASLWNILSYAGKSSHVVGWWTTSPVEAVCGSIVADSFHAAREPLGMPWEIPAKSVYPQELAEELSKLRVHPQTITESQIMRLVPRLFETDPSQDWRIAGIATILARDLTNLNVTKHLLTTRDWDFSSVYFIGLDHLSHMAMRLRPPALEGSAEWDCEIYGEVIDRAYVLYDEWIGELVKMVGSEVVVGVISDHGFYWDHRRQHGLGIEHTAPCREHGPRGCLFFSGPKIRKKFSVKHASILDICPTLLHLFSLPIGRDMDGCILKSMVDVKEEVSFMRSWDRVCGISNRSEANRPSTEETLHALDQLRALGYLADLPKEKQDIIDEQECDRIYHLGQAYLEDRRIRMALPLLEEAFRRRPERSDIGASLAGAWALAGKRKKAGQVLRKIVRIRRRDSAKARKELVVLEKQLAGKSFREMDYEEAYRLHCVSARAMLDETNLSATLALADWFDVPVQRGPVGKRRLHSLRVKKATAGKERLCALAEEFPENILFLKNAGSCCLDAGEASSAKFYFERVVAWDPDEPGAVVALACCELELLNYDAAERLAREAVALDARYSPAWLVLARVLIAKQNWSEAKVAAQNAARTLPDRKVACELLAQIAKEENGDVALAKRYRRVARHAARMLRRGVETKRAKRGEVDKMPVLSESDEGDYSDRAPLGLSSEASPGATIVITGLPRSGTSLLAQMLAAGGMPIFQDGERVPDEHNPLGYFEHSFVRNLAENPEWIRKVRGHVVKVVIPLVWYLPRNLDCRIIFVKRDLSEIIESQNRMAPLITSSAKLENVYRYQLAKTREQFASENFPCLELVYHDLISSPISAATQLATFLGKELDIQKMASVVNPKLYRVRKTEL